MSFLLNRLSKFFKSAKPDLMMIYGDRMESLITSLVCLNFSVPILHFQGGDLSGNIDEKIRHSITKMSHLHFVSAEDYRNRVVQLGENPSNVFLVGALGLDGIDNIDFLSKKELEEALEIKFRTKNLLITFHPVTLEKNQSSKQMKELLLALDELESTNLIFTMPNSDPDGRKLFDQIEEFVNTRENSYVFTSLGQKKYLSCMPFIDAVVGNSSSGLIEVPSFSKPTINIGDRQRGRLKAKSVIDCEPNKNSILNALKQAYSKDFQEHLSKVKNPYGKGGSSKAIVEILEKISFKDLLKKEFFNMKIR